MKIVDMQSQAKTLIEAHTPLDGITVLKDDGTWPQTPNRESALSTDGIVIIVWEVTGGTVTSDTSSRRRNLLHMTLPITVEENRSVNQSTGLGKDPDYVIEEVIRAISGQPTGDPFELDPDAWSNLGIVDGVGQRLVLFTHDLPI